MRTIYADTVNRVGSWETRLNVSRRVQLGTDRILIVRHFSQLTFEQNFASSTCIQ
jgi:hypothetical protein